MNQTIRYIAIGAIVAALAAAAMSIPQHLIEYTDVGAPKE